MTKKVTIAQLELALGAAKKYSDDKFLTKDVFVGDGSNTDAGKIVNTVTHTKEDNVANEGHDDVKVSKVTLTTKSGDMATGEVTSDSLEFQFPTVDSVNAIDTRVAAVEEAAGDGKNLASIAGLDGTTPGIVKMTGVNTFAVDTVKDADVASDSTLAKVIAAFGSDSGSDVAIAGSNVAVKGESVTLEGAADEDGKPSVYVKTPEGTAGRVVTAEEMRTAIADATAGSQTYAGKFRFFFEADTIENAVNAVTTKMVGDDAYLKVGDKGIVHSTTDDKFVIVTMNEGAVDQADATWYNGYWAWVEDLLNSTPAGNEYPSGRIVYDSTAKKVDVIEDRIGAPDDNGLTYNEAGAIALKMAVQEAYGASAVSTALNAGNLGYGDGKTIKTAIDEIVANVATDEEVQAMLDRVFAETPDTPPVVAP